VTHRKFLLLFAAAVPVALALANFAYGGPAMLAVCISAILILVAHFDNHTGSCLLVTIMLLVTIGVLLSLLMVTARIAIH
jgi:hypothetical protein